MLGVNEFIQDRRVSEDTLNQNWGCLFPQSVRIAGLLRLLSFLGAIDFFLGLLSDWLAIGRESGEENASLQLSLES